MALGHSRIFHLASACILAGAFLFASGRDPSPKSTARNACRQLLKSLDDSKVKSSGLEYEASAKGAWSVLNQLDSEWRTMYIDTAWDYSHDVARTHLYRVPSTYIGRGRCVPVYFSLGRTLCREGWWP